MSNEEVEHLKVTIILKIYFNIKENLIIIK